MISIVIPLYNKEQSILKTLDSVISQTFAEYECFIVNDGSTDNSLQVVQNFLKVHNDMRFYIINKQNGGVCSARNVGIKESNGEFIALLDADDLWEKEYLQEQMRMVEDFPECGMWSINYAELYQEKIVRRIPTGLPIGYRGIVENYYEIQGRVSDLACSSSVLLRKEVFEHVGYFDERIRYSEDVDMWWRVIATYPFAFYDRYMVYYRFDAENRTMNRYRILKYFLPYYSDKYYQYKAVNPVFYQFSQRWCAVWLVRYYFHVTSERAHAYEAAQKLDYSVLTPKYRWYFRAPFFIGVLIYYIVTLKKKLFG